MAEEDRDGCRTQRKLSISTAWSKGSDTAHASRTCPDAAARAGDGGAGRRRLDRPAAGAANASGQDHLERCHGPCVGSAFSARDIIGQADPQSLLPSLQCVLADPRRPTDAGSTEPSLPTSNRALGAPEFAPVAAVAQQHCEAANGEVDSFLSGTQMWFDVRWIGHRLVQAWAKRWVLVIAVVVVCIGNIDSIAIARALYAGGATRATVIQQVTDLNFCSTGDPTTCAEEAANFLQRALSRWAGRRPIPKMGSGAGR